MPDEVIQKSLEEISPSILKTLQSLYTATKTVIIYPAENPSVVRMVENAFDAVTDLIPPGGSLDLSFLEGKLVVNGEMLDDALQKRGIVGNFHELMKGRRISSITFWSGLTKEELRKFLKVLGTKAPVSDASEAPEVYELLQEEEVKHVEVDEQIYVAISKREKVVDARVAVEREEDSALKALKDEVFARFLAGEASLGEVGKETVEEIASDPDKMVSMVQGLISAQGWDTDVEKLPFRIDETLAILERVAGLIEQVDDPLVRNKLNREVSKITAQIETPQLTEMLLKSSGLDLEKPPSELPKVLLPLMEDRKLTGVIESVIQEYKELASRQSDDDWPTPRMSALQSVIEEARSSADGQVAEQLGGMIEESGIRVEKPETMAAMSGTEVGKALATGRDVSTCDRASGPALVGATVWLFENGNDQQGVAVMERLKERFERQSPEAKVVAARQLWGMFQQLRDLGKEAYAADLIDEVSGVLEESKAAVRTIASLAESMEQVASVGPAADSFEGEEGLGMSRKAAEKLLSSDTGKVVQAVFTSGDKAAQDAISRVLLEMEDKAIPALLDTAMDATDEETLESVAESIRQLDTDPMPQIAARFSQEIEPFSVINLVKLTGMVGDESAVSVFNPLMIGEDVEIRVEVIKALGKLGGKASLQMVLSESVEIDPSIRIAAIRALGEFRDYMAVRRLMEIVASKKKGELEEEDSTLIAACSSLGKLHVRQAVPDLVEIAKGGKRRQDYSEEARASATAALGQIGGDDSQKALQKLLKDKSMLVRSTARRVLHGS